MPVQLLAMVMVQTAEPEQHAPVTHGFGVQLEPAPMNVWVPPQPATVRARHVPLFWQQAPTRLAQGFGEQVVPLPMYVSPAVPPQAPEPVPEAFLIAQVPSAAQQAPVGMTQGFVGAQAVPTPWNSPGSTQAVGSVTVQTPRVEQQAPAVARQGLGEQVVPMP